MIVIPQKDAESERSMIMSKLASEIQHLAKMHIIYRWKLLQDLKEKKNYIMSMILSAGINTRKEFDPVTNNLFHRYFS
jgi:hypothetical protein